MGPDAQCVTPEKPSMLSRYWFASTFVLLAFVTSAIASARSNATALRPWSPQASVTGAPGPIQRSFNGVPAPTPSPGIVVVSQSFAGSSTPRNQWFFTSGACLTAGTKMTPRKSIPECGSSAPQDPNGSGALQLTAPVQSVVSLVGFNAPIPTALGV